MGQQLAAWGPTFVTVIGWIFFAGVMWQKQQNAERRLDSHDVQHEESSKQINLLNVDVAKLNSWKDGYAAARAVYDRAIHAGGD